MKKLIVINILITLILLFLVESISSITWYQRQRSNGDHLASVYVIKRALEKLRTFSSSKVTTETKNNKSGSKETKKNKYTKLVKLLELRNQGMDIYPYYLYDPQLHTDQSIYYLSNPANTTVLYCNENNFWTIYKTDEIGFRNPLGQLNKNVDFIFIGDSFSEGACVNDNETFASYFRENGRSVMNLSRGGSGPLQQLAILKEYSIAATPKTVIWYVFTGNDLHNLREEKTTKLINYLTDENYSQNLYSNKTETSDTLKKFLDNEIESNIQRYNKDMKIRYNHAYGETLDIIDAEKKEKFLLKRSAEEILKMTNKIGANLFIVIINHYTYSYELQDLTKNVIIDFAKQTGTNYYEITREQLNRERSNLYSKPGPHFSPEGYRTLAQQIYEHYYSLH